MGRNLRLLLVFFACCATASAQGWPPEIENLQVLPADTPVDQVIGTMRDFTFALGVRCQFCHVGEEGQPIHEFDFASDDKQTKGRAREMIKMTAAINQQFLAKLKGEKHDLEVTCVTCHRGAQRPEPLSAVVTRVVMEEGLDAAVEKYQELREQYYGSGSFDFGEASLVQSAEALLAKERVVEATRLLELNLEHHPESQWTAGTLAGAYEQLGRTVDALSVWKRLLEKNPRDPRIQQQIQRLEGAG